MLTRVFLISLAQHQPERPFPDSLAQNKLVDEAYLHECGHGDVVTVKGLLLKIVALKSWKNHQQQK